MSKYGNRRVIVDNIRFDSQAEARRYEQLKLLERMGQISALRVHPRYRLFEPCEIDGRRWPRLSYEADFEYIEQASIVVEDVKGTETLLWKWKARAFAEKYPDRLLRIIPAREV